MRREILEDTTKRCVYPNRLAIPMTGRSDLELVKGFSPSGLLFVRILRASGLPEKGGLRKLVGQHKPDAYVKLAVGAEERETYTVKNSADPEWEEPVW